MKGLLILGLILFPIWTIAGYDDPILHEDKIVSEQIQLIREIPTTPVRDQYKTKTCWSFSGISLLETELIRMGKGEIDLSEMYIVRQNYERKADRFVRMHGKINFTAGGEANDVTDVVADFGIFPESAYSGLKDNEENHTHLQMDKELEEYVLSLIHNPNKELPGVWQNDIRKVLDSYLGKLPESFIYEGTEYTPKSFSRYLGLDMNQYVMITSFTHMPYYEEFILEVPDNWSWGKSYNLPLGEMIQIIDSAIYKGYSLAWAADITEPGFSFEKGMALVPQFIYEPRSKRIAEKWEKKSKEEKEELIFDSGMLLEELTVTPEKRQIAFDNYLTTDDHGMHIVGIAENKDGKSFYYVKNSWGGNNPYHGFLFVSKSYMEYKTISIMVNKEALPEAIAEKLNL
jgi:bleomycin hydrolase